MLQQNCVGGCPCESYPCSETTTALVTTTTSLTTSRTTTETTVATTVMTSTTNATLSSNVLLLGTFKQDNVPMTVDFYGKFKKWETFLII